MLRKKDVLIIGIVLVLAAAIYCGLMLTRAGQTVSGVVTVQVDGVPYGTLWLDAPGELRVQQAGGEENLIVVENGEVTMAFSSCRNQLCLHQGGITADNWKRRAMGRTIVCLPNRVLVELTLEDGHPSLDDPDAPDI